MPRALLPSGIELEYDTFGAPDDPTLLLVAGFTAQMTSWEDGFCRLAADHGHHVVRFDNRDCGLSTKLDGVVADGLAAMSAFISGAPVPEVPYSLSDMAADGIGLLDHLGVDRAHAVGASMGGMIVQHMAIEFSDRLHSVTSIMSTVGDLAYGTPTDEAVEVLLSPPPPSRDEFVAAAVRNGVWSSKRYFDADAAMRRAAADYDRAFYPEGATRQLAAIYASGDRSAALRDVDVPTLVIHGLDDTLIHPSGGRRTAELVPGARLVEIEDMGHDRPEPLWPVIVGAIVEHVAAVVAADGVEVAS